VQRAKRQQKSRHKTDHPCLRFFWKVMLVGYVTAESQDVQPRRAGTKERGLDGASPLDKQIYIV